MEDTIKIIFTVFVGTTVAFVLSKILDKKKRDRD